MVNRMTFAHNGMNQDITKSKHPVEFYYSANNIRIFSNDKGTSLSAETEKGNSLKITIPSVHINEAQTKITYGDKELKYTVTQEGSEISEHCKAGILMRDSYDQVIIGYAISRTGIILITTDLNRGVKKGMDCVWEINNISDTNYNLELKYCRNMGLSVDNPLQILYNFESLKVEKIYWADGVHQVRFLNLRQSIENEDLVDLIDLSVELVDIVGTYITSQPIIQSLSSGGDHTAGMIQYAYNLYNLNSSQTRISPLTKLVPLNKGINLGGGKVNEIVGTVPIVKVENIDPNYTHIRLYAIKYTSYNTIPDISLIADSKVGKSKTFTYFDDGRKINDISIEEFTFLGSNPFVPKHINSKDNSLFFANIKEMSFDVDIDCRAYSFNNIGISEIYDSVELSEIIPNTTIGRDKIIIDGTNYDDVYPEHDSVNLDYDTFKYQLDGETLGGTGKFIEYELTVKTFGSRNEQSNYALLKDNEVYRIGIEFYNLLGQVSPVKWIGDFRTPSNNLKTFIKADGSIEYYGNTLSIKLLPAFYTWMASTEFETADSKPVGYRVVRAERKISDRTILCQGALTQMMVRTTSHLRGGGANYWDWDKKEQESKLQVKFPITVSRGFDKLTDQYGPLKPLRWTSHLEAMTFSGGSSNNGGEGNSNPTEIWEGHSNSEKRQYTWQYTRMYQMHSPDVLFNQGLSFGQGMELNIKGIVKSTRNDIIYRRLRTEDNSERTTVRLYDTNNLIDDPDISYLGLFGPTEATNVRDVTTINREYHSFKESGNKTRKKIYGAPEIADRGQGTTSYNNDSDFKYANTMDHFLSDSHSGGQDDQEAILSMNSFGERSIMLVEGEGNKAYQNRARLEQLFAESNIDDTEGLLLGEICIPEDNIYVSNIYGGNSHDAKTRNIYVAISEYNKLSVTHVEMDSPGDTYIDIFRFARLSKTDVDSRNNQVLQHTDIISYPVETTVDLKNRSDKSITGWDSELEVSYDDFHDYNRVYSQQSNLIHNSVFDDSFKKIRFHDNQIFASKKKVSGEKIDSWTDILVNESMKLDGKYGSITALGNFNDTLFAFQDNAIAALSINPRVQVQGGDGISVELGTGKLLDNYKYITTISGTLNKWSVIETPAGLYYYDALNNSFNRIGNDGLKGLGDNHGMKSFFKSNIIFNDIIQDNPLLRRSVICAYDPISNDIYVTVLQSTKSFTLAFNEGYNVFTSFYDYIPSLYIIKGFKMVTIGQDLKGLWEHGSSKYASFYGKTYPSSITYLINPQGRDCEFNNISFKSEVYNEADIKYNNVSKQTLTHIKAYNEYQSTALTPLILHKNIERKERMWSARIPRVVGSMDRMRGHWMYLQVMSNNIDNNRLVLHDMNVDYIQYP